MFFVIPLILLILGITVSVINWLWLFIGIITGLTFSYYVLRD